MSNIRIGVIGLGGVGGFYGGLLAKHYSTDTTVEICFVARGSHYEAIKKNGLEVCQKGDCITGRPDLIVQNIADLGIVDYVLLCTKAYDLEEVIKEIKKIVTSKTVIIPLLNGVSAYEQLVNKFSVESVWQGCTYMVSRLRKAGVIDNPSGRQKVYFGGATGISPQMLSFEKILKKAGINAICTSTIAKEVWEKYILVSASATGTTYFNCSIGELMNTYPLEIRNLVIEATAIARAKGIELASGAEETVIERLEAIPYDSTTSMHSDFIANKLHTEIDVMTSYMVMNGVNHSISTNTYNEMYKKLLVKQGHYTM